MTTGKEMPMQLNYVGWYLEERKKTEAALNHMRTVMGTFSTERNPTYAYLEGYLSGVAAMYRKFEDCPSSRKNIKPSEFST